MFRSKKDVDAHVRDVFSKCVTESERLKLCFGIARQYTGIKEFDTARRYLETYLASDPANIAETQKLMGDIQLELGDGEKALELYKASYSNGKGRDSLNRVCDLFARGFGTLETPESKKQWQDLQKLPANGNSFTLTSNSPAMPKRTQTPVGPPKTGFSHTSFNNGSSSPLMTSANKANGGNVDLQLRYLERRFDDGLGKILDQNTMALEQMLRFKEDIKNLSDKIEQVAETQQKMQADNSLQCTHFKEEMERLAKLIIAATDSQKKEGSSNSPSLTARTNGLTVNSVSSTNFSEVPLSQLFKKPEGSWNCEGCYVTNPKENTSCVSCGTCRPGFENTVKAEAVPAPVHPAFNFGFSSAKPVTPPTLNFGGNNSIATVASETVVDNSTIKQSDENKGFMGLNLTGKFSFADLAKTNNSSFADISKTNNSSFADIAKSNNSGFTFGGGNAVTPSFAGAGAPLFSGLNLANKANTEEKTPIESTIANTSTHAEGEDDFVPTQEFQPVIPLPPLVEVKKGDENENTMAEYRAKLYRFVSETKEWKERGVGNIKLLQAKVDPKKCRVVMWREKIGKLACNFNLFPDIKITNYQNNPKVLCWKCQDFAEDGAWELFTLRFSNEDNCTHFKEEMERLAKLTIATTDSQKAEDSSHSPSLTARTNGPTVSSVSSTNSSEVPLSQLFKKPEGSWNCDGCYVTNPKENTSCVSCGTCRPGFENTVKAEAEPAPVQPTFSFGFPSAKPVTPPTLNFGGNNSIATVTSETVVDTSTLTQFDKNKDFMGLNLSGKFSFADLAKTNNSSFADIAKSNNNNSGFTFGGGNAATPSFAGAGAPLFSGLNLANKANTEEKTPVESTIANTSTHAEGEDDFVPTQEFQPVIPLPPLVEVKKGDENENTLAEYRAKLYRFVSETKEWKERGVGNIKLLQAKVDPKKCRVVMWREKIGKLACNFNLFPDIKITNYQNNPKVLCWKCQDFAEDGAWELFTLRFSNEDNCTHFKEEMERLAKLTIATTDSQKTEDSSNSPSLTARTNGPTVNSVSSTNSSEVPLSQLFKKPEGSWNCDGCYVTNPKENTSCVSCGTCRPGFENTVKAEAEPAPVQPTFNFGFSSAKPVTPPTLNFGGNNSIATVASETVVDNSTIKQSDENIDFMGLNLSGKFSFADLAKTNNSSFADIAKSNNSGFTFGGGNAATSSFAGAGAPLFSGLNFSNKGNTEEKTPVESTIANTSTHAEGEDNFVPTQEFQPVIPLPPLVEVKKGDENENTIAEYRAKLYRFVSETKEWKERGVGNIKLLQAKDDPKKCRVVMWREKIGKLACNFSLFPDIKVTNYQNNPKVLCWKCQDCAEGTAWETFTLRFSNEENCEDFKNKLMEYANGAPSVSNVSSTEADTSSSCPGCRGCDADVYQFPEHKYECEEAVIDIPLDADASTIPPFNVSLGYFDQSDNDSPNKNQTTPIGRNEVSGVTDDASNKGSNMTPFSFSLQTPDKTPNPISFQFKSPNFSSPSIFGSPIGGSIFSPPQGTPSFGSTPSPFVSPFAQTPGENKDSAPQLGSQFSFSHPAFQQSTDPASPNDDGNHQQEEDEYEDVDDEDECMFEDDAHIYIQDDADSSGDFSDKGEGVVRVLYDGESYCARLVILVEEETVAEHLVAVETILEPKGEKTYEWIGVCNYESPIKSKIRVTFSNEEAFQNFSTVMADGLEFAEQAGITEGVLLEDSSGY